MTNSEPNSGKELVDVEVQDDAVIGKAMFWSLLVFVCVGVIAAGVVFWVTRPKEKEDLQEAKHRKLELRGGSKVSLPKVAFKDITEQAGIAFQHQNGAYGAKLLPETMGGGNPPAPASP